MFLNRYKYIFENCRDALFKIGGPRVRGVSDATDCRA